MRIISNIFWVLNEWGTTVKTLDGLSHLLLIIISLSTHSLQWPSLQLRKTRLAGRRAKTLLGLLWLWAHAVTSMGYFLVFEMTLWNNTWRDSKALVRWKLYYSSFSISTFPLVWIWIPTEAASKKYLLLATLGACWTHIPGLGLQGSIWVGVLPG